MSITEPTQLREREKQTERESERKRARETAKGARRVGALKMPV